MKALIMYGTGIALTIVGMLTAKNELQQIATVIIANMWIVGALLAREGEMKTKSGAELSKEFYESNYLNKNDSKLAKMVDSNTALAVAEGTLKYQDDYEHSVREHEKCKAHCDYITQELELCKAHNLMLYDRLKTTGCYGRFGSDDAEVAKDYAVISATKETIEAYRNEIVQKANSEQRESDADAVYDLLANDPHGSRFADIAYTAIKNNKGK